MKPKTKIGLGLGFHWVFFWGGFRVSQPWLYLRQLKSITYELSLWTRFVLYLRAEIWLRRQLSPSMCRPSSSSSRYFCSSTWNFIFYNHNIRQQLLTHFTDIWTVNNVPCLQFSDSSFFSSFISRLSFFFSFLISGFFSPLTTRFCFFYIAILVPFLSFLFHLNQP